MIVVESTKNKREKIFNLCIFELKKEWKNKIEN